MACPKKYRRRRRNGSHGRSTRAGPYAKMLMKRGRKRRKATRIAWLKKRQARRNPGYRVWHKPIKDGRPRQFTDMGVRHVSTPAEAVRLTIASYGKADKGFKYTTSLAMDEVGPFTRHKNPTFYKTFLRSATSFDSFANDNRSAAQIRKGTKMEFTAQ